MNQRTASATPPLSTIDLLALAALRSFVSRSARCSRKGDGIWAHSIVSSSVKERAPRSTSTKRTPSSGSASSAGRCRSSTPTTYGIGADAYDSFDVGSTGM